MATGLAGHFVAMARNNAWANHRLLGACEALRAEEFAALRTGFFPSLRATFNHILQVDQYYIDALEGLDALRRYSEPDPDFSDAKSMRLAQTGVPSEATLAMSTYWKPDPSSKKCWVLRVASILANWNDAVEPLSDTFPTTK